ATALSRNTPARFGDWGAEQTSRLPKPRLDRERPGYLCGPRVGGLAASSPAVLGDRRCGSRGRRFAALVNQVANGMPAPVVNKIEREIPRVLRVMRVATEDSSRKRRGSSRISSIFVG